jgi:SdrD B-like domain/Putative Ig domain
VAGGYVRRSDRGAGPDPSVGATGEKPPDGTGHRPFPANPSKYGPLAGIIVGGDEDQNGVYSITPSGISTFYSLGISEPESLQIADSTGNYYGVDSANRSILAGQSSDFSWKSGDLLVASEAGAPGPQLARVCWNGAALQVQALTYGTGSATVGQWEGISFAPMGIGSVAPPVTGLGSLAGSVYDDLNNDGKKQAGEPGVDGVTVTLTGTTQGNAVTMTTATGADGSYYFGHVGPGTYSILESTPAGSIEGKDTAGTLGGTAGIGRIDGISMTPGAVGTGYLFGLDRPPHFTTTPVTQASASIKQLSRPYVYNAGASDPDGDPLTFTLLYGPSGMTVATTGQVNWGGAFAGSFPVALKVSDGRGGSAEQDYTLTVIPAGSTQQFWPPYFTSTPVVDAVASQSYAYQATAFEPDIPSTWTLTFSVVSGPAGLTSTSTGLVSWTPTASQLGPNPVTLQVIDNRGSTATQSYTIVVRQDPANDPPMIVSTLITSTIVNQDYQYPVKALDDDHDALSYSLLVAPPRA